MTKRRMHFAAPFVLVTACGQPAPVQSPPSPPIEGLDYVRNAEMAMRDGGTEVAQLIDAAPDAPPPDPRYLATIVLPERDEQPGGFVSCHNFGPGSSGCNPPRPIHLPAERRSRQIINIAARADTSSAVTIALDTDDKVERGTPVSARTPAMKSRTRVGYVHTARPSSAILVVTLSTDEVNGGAELEIGPGPAEPIPPPQPVMAAIAKIEIHGDSTIITIDAGSEDGVVRGSRGDVVDRKGRSVPGGQVTVFKVLRTQSVAKIKLTADQAKTHGRVRLEPSPDL